MATAITTSPVRIRYGFKLFRDEVLVDLETAVNDWITSEINAAPGGIYYTGRIVNVFIDSVGYFVAALEYSWNTVNTDWTP